MWRTIPIGLEMDEVYQCQIEVSSRGGDARLKHRFAYLPSCPNRRSSYIAVGRVLLLCYAMLCYAEEVFRRRRRGLPIMQKRCFPNGGNWNWISGGDGTGWKRMRGATPLPLPLPVPVPTPSLSLSLSGLAGINRDRFSDCHSGIE